MLTIRLARVGAKKKPHFRVVVVESRRSNEGRFVEILGHYNPRTEPAELKLNRDRVDYWIGKGAQPSDTVRSFLRRPQTAAQPAETPAAEPTETPAS